MTRAETMTASTPPGEALFYNPPIRLEGGGIGILDRLRRR